jgi:hypothetical protein
MSKVLLIQNDQKAIKKVVLGHFVNSEGLLCKVVDVIYPHPDVPEHSTVTRTEVHVFHKNGQRVYDGTKQSAVNLLTDAQKVVSYMFRDETATEVC